MDHQIEIRKPEVEFYVTLHNEKIVLTEVDQIYQNHKPNLNQPNN